MHRAAVGPCSGTVVMKAAVLSRRGIRANNKLKCLAKQGGVKQIVMVSSGQDCQSRKRKERGNHRATRVDPSLTIYQDKPSCQLLDHPSIYSTSVTPPLTIKYCRKAFSNRSRYWSGGICNQPPPTPPTPLAQNAVRANGTHNSDFPTSRKSQLATTLNRLKEVETPYSIDEPDYQLVSGIVKAEEERIVHDTLRAEVLCIVVDCFLQDTLCVCVSAKRAEGGVVLRG